MKLSVILEEMKYRDRYAIISEKEFDVLALTSSEIGKAACVFVDNIKYLCDIKTNVSMICATEEVKNELNRMNWKGGICVTAQPRLMFFEVHNFLAGIQKYSYCREKFKTQIGINCNIHETAIIASDNVVIGNNVVIEEYVIIRENTIIGDNTIIRAGSKIGGMGFEFKRMPKGILSVQHLGGVCIGENVEIQYNSCVDRAVYPWDNTVIGNDTKIDNLVHIGHAVKIEDNVMLVAQSGIGGRTVIQSDTWIGFASTVSNGLNIGKKSRVNIGAVATKDVLEEHSVTGNFAIEHEKFIKNLKRSVSND